MNDFKNKLEQLEKLCQQNFDLSASSEHEDNDDAYVKVRSDVLDLFAKAQKELPEDELTVFKTSVIDFLCRNSGCALDMEVLDSYTPRVLSENDLKYIMHNSALARWF